MTKAEIENYLQDEALLQAICVTLVSQMKMVCVVEGNMELYARLNKYSPSRYIEFARKNLKEKLSKM